MAEASPFSVASAYSEIRTALEAGSTTPLPSPSAVAAATASLPTTLPLKGSGDAAALSHILTSLTPGFNGPKTSATYYGFVTGGVLPIAEAADNIVTAWDQNVQVHLPTQTVATAVEDAALRMLVQAVRLEPSDWAGRTFTTGATGANILGLACGREEVLRRRAGGSVGSVGELGLLEACRRAGVVKFQVLTTMGHSSLAKAASVVGMGRNAVIDVGRKERPWEFEWDVLEQRLKEEGTASVVAVSFGEVNTGRFATRGSEDMQRLRALCDHYGAWIHVDGAFGLFARSLPQTPEFALIHRFASGLELADSITGDCHKCLNVPYDCGFFFTRTPEILTAVFQNANAAYLSAGSPASIPSPLNIGLENSRRFRALPVYAVLMSLGADGVADLMAGQVKQARAVARFVDEHEGLELLPDTEGRYEDTGIIVLFRAKDEAVNEDLVSRVWKDGRIYVSGTSWEGRKAVRIAVSGWKVDVERDSKLIADVLEDLVKTENAF